MESLIQSLLEPEPAQPRPSRIKIFFPIANFMANDMVIRIWVYANAPAEFTSLFQEAGTHAWIAHVPLSLADTAIACMILKQAARAVVRNDSVLYLGHLHSYLLPSSD
jgi:hypothetical protein